MIDNMKIFLLFFIVTAFVSLAGAAESPVGFIVFLDGEAIIKTKHKDTKTYYEKEPTRVSIPVYKEDQLSIGSVSKAKLQMADGNFIYLAARTSMKIKENIADTSTNTFKSVFNLLYGKIRSVVNRKYKGKNKFEVGTANAVMGIRGTIAAIRYDGRRTTTYNRVGKVTLRARGGPRYSLKSNQIMSISGKRGNILITPPKKASPRQVKEFRSGLISIPANEHRLSIPTGTTREKLPVQDSFKSDTDTSDTGTEKQTDFQGSGAGDSAAGSSGDQASSEAAAKTGSEEDSEGTPLESVADKSAGSEPGEGAGAESGTGSGDSTGTGDGTEALPGQDGAKLDSQTVSKEDAGRMPASEASNTAPFTGSQTMDAGSAFGPAGADAWNPPVLTDTRTTSIAPPMSDTLGPQIKRVVVDRVQSTTPITRHPEGELADKVSNVYSRQPSMEVILNIKLKR